MTTAENSNTAVVLRYLDGCNSGDRAVLLSTLAPAVVHYFLPAKFKTIRGAEALTDYWQKYKAAFRPVWQVDQIIGAGDRVATEWSCLFTPREGGPLLSRGAEWYLLENGLIREIRAYFIADGSADSELEGFPYAERGYLMR